MKTELNNIFIIRAKEVHNDKYDYSKVEYIDSKTPILKPNCSDNYIDHLLYM